MSTPSISIDNLSKVGFRQVGTAPIPHRPGLEIPIIESTPPTSTPSRPRRKFALYLLAIVAVSGVVVGVTLYLQHAARFQETDDAFVEADVHPISSRVTGDVEAVLVNDNQHVTKGQPLVRLDQRDFQVKLQNARTGLTQAETQVPQAEATLEQSHAALRQAQAQCATSKANWVKAQQDFQRVEALRHSQPRALSQVEFDAAKAAWDGAQASLKGAEAARDAATANVQIAEANLNAARAGRDHAKTAVDDAELQLSYTILRAPENGRIAKKTVQTGQHLQPGQALLAVVAPDRWVVANFKENQLSEMHPGQSVEITVDAIHGRHFHGCVDSFAPGTGAKFTLLPPDNATGNFTKIVQRVPVKILLQAEDVTTLEQHLFPGLSVTATVQVRK